GFVTPATIIIAANTLLAGGAIVPYTGTYVPGATPTGTVQINQVGAIGTVILAGPTPATVTTATYSNASSDAGTYVLNSITAPAGFMLESVTNGVGNTLSAPYSQNLTDDGTIIYNINYTALVLEGTVRVNQLGAVGTVDLLGPTPATVTTATYSNTNSGTGNYTLSVTTPAGFTLAGVTDGAGSTLTSPYTQTLADEGTITYNVTYNAIPQADPAITVKTASNETPAQSEVVTYTVSYTNLGNVDATNVTLVDDYDETRLENISSISDVNCTDDGTQITCHFATIAPDAAESFSYTAQVRMDAPAGEDIINTATITNADENVNNTNDTASVAVNVVALPDVTMTKTADGSSLMHNEVITYTLTFTRTNTTIADALNFTVSDTVTGTSRIAGSNGGSVNVIMNNGTCEGTDGATCVSNQIDQAPIVVRLPEVLGAQAVITYEARANNQGIPTSGASMISNTATAVENAGLVANLTASLDLPLAGPASEVPPTIVQTAGGGGGGGGGGGRVVYQGTMEIEVEKLLSLDGVNYRPATEEGMAIIIPEKQVTTLFVKVRIDNEKNPFSAKDIRFRHSFERGGSDMFGALKNVQNAAYNPENGEITVGKVLAGKSLEFSYEVRIDERGQSDLFALDKLELLGFTTGLSTAQGHLTYKGTGVTTSYVIAGQLPANVIPVDFTAPAGEDSALRVRVSSNTRTAGLGDSVTFTVTAYNTGNTDLTNLVVTHEYDESGLKVTRAVGARDNGSELSWNRTILRPGQTATYQFTAQVKGTAASVVRGLTRAALSEFDYNNQIENWLNIGAAALQPDRSYELARTGAGQLMLMLLISVLGYFGYRHQHYLRLKRLALKPL
ncbi:MAG: DUF11 domain-containing protein, partial [Candidatus Peregrinibacteria bacterium]